MRFHSLIFILAAAVLVPGCANEGVIVRKDSGPMPLYASLGVDGTYAFMLRDNAGTMHRQIVTPDVFERYAVGQYFNDLQPWTPQKGPTDDSKEMRTAALSAPHVVRHVASVRKTRHLAAKSSKHSKSHKAVAKHGRKKSARLVQRKHKQTHLHRLASR